MSTSSRARPNVWPASTVGRTRRTRRTHTPVTTTVPASLCVPRSAPVGGVEAGDGGGIPQPATSSDTGPTFDLVTGPWAAQWWQEVAGEFLATLFFCLGAFGSIISSRRGFVETALGTGFATFAVTAVFSGVGVLTAFNWGVTLTHTALYSATGKRKRSLWLLLGGYVASEYLGALAAVGLLRSFYSQADVELALPDLTGGQTQTRAFLAEMVLSAVLYVLFVWSGMVQFRTKAVRTARLSGTERALVFGLATVFVVFAGTRASGASLNPSRYLAVATVAGRAPDWWIWVLAPLAGAVLASLLLLMLHWFFLNPQARPKGVFGGTGGRLAAWFFMDAPVDPAGAWYADRVARA
jgi:glycerol uptake facilitator-like aquaporin